MKNLLLSAVIIVFGLSQMNAQGGLNAGVSLGLPVTAIPWTFNVTLDVNYMWNGGNFKVGFATGFSNSFGKTTDNGIGYFDFPDVQFLPIAGAVRLAVSEKFTLGADLGHAIGINEGNDGGFYYAPKVQYAISEFIDIVLSYRGVSRDSDSFDVVNLGVEFEL